MPQDPGRIDLDALRAVVALVEARSVTKAADRLGLTQSGMSHALRRLRTRFDDPLLVRGQSGMQPTPRAQNLAHRAAAVLTEVEALENDRPGFEPKTAERVFTLSLDDNQSTHLIPRLLARLEIEAPKVNLHLLPPPLDARDALERGAVDLVVGLMEPAQAGLYTQALYVDSFVCIVRKGHPTLSRRPDLQKYVEAGHILVSGRLPARSFVDDLLQQQGLQRRIVLRIPHFLAAVEVASETDLVLTLSSRLGKVVSTSHPLKMFTPPLNLPEVPIHQTWHERLHHDPAHIWLRGLLARLTRNPGKKLVSV